MSRPFTPLIAVLALVAACSATSQLTVKRNIDKYDRTAFEALHTFQQGEEALWHANAPWPNADQHQKIGAALSTAYTLIGKVAQAGIDLKPGQPMSAVLIQDLTDLTSEVAKIVAMSQTAPGSSTAQAKDAQNQTAKLVSSVQQRAK